MTKLHSSRALCSTLAIATALLVGAGPAKAQALLGTVTSSSGVGTISTAPGSTIIPVTSQQAIINWSATGPSNGGLTTFSNAGSNTSFTGTSNFAILNRVSPSVTGNAIFMGGNISSTVNGQVGGTVYFYSPNGIVIGNTASINVGSLGLTTLPIADVQGVWMNGFGGAAPSVAFGAAAAGSYVRTDAGSALNSNGVGNYVALVAPRVEHRGTIRTDSGAALVAAGAATISFAPNGLYTIEVSTGSNDANGIVVDGGRIERNSTSFSNHHAYLVSVPANNAMTMLVQGGAQLGFDIAGSAAVEGNSIILAAGREFIGGALTNSSEPSASASIDNATIGSNLFIATTADARISSSNGATTLLGFLSILAPRQIILAAQTSPLSIGGELRADAKALRADGTGGSVIVAAQNGQLLSIGGGATLVADGWGADAVDDGLDAVSGTGGTINVQSTDGGTIAIGGQLEARANGIGGNHGFTSGAAGSGTGGTVNIDARGGNSTISVGGFTTLGASGTGGSTIECSICSVGGGNGTGGTINVNGSVRAANTGANRLDFNGGLSLVAEGSGGAGDASAGAGRGGTVRMVTSDGTILNSLTGFTVSTDGSGGVYLGIGAGAGGSGTGGEVQIGAYEGSGGSFNFAGGQFLNFISAHGTGGGATSGSGTGGNAAGGRIALDAKSAAITIGGTGVYMNADSVGGSAFGGTGGSAAGGSVFTHAYGSNLTITGDLTQLAAGFAGSGLVGGVGQGGIVSAFAELGSVISVGGQAWLDSLGIGGQGGVASGGIGGRGQGGDVSLVAASGGSLAIGSVLLDNFSSGGSGFQGGAADAGHGTITSNGGNIDIADQLSVTFNAFGGRSDGAIGGAATGGRFELVANGGTIDVGGVASLAGNAFGGASLAELSTGGAATGGGLQVHARNGGTLTLGGALFASSEGSGGEAPAISARAGDGRGGSVDVGASGTNSTLDARGAVLLTANGYGGSGVCGECVTGGGGGDGTGGQAFVQTNGGDGNRILFGNDVQISANGVGGQGSGGAGGHGRGGAASVFLANDGRITVGSGLALSARGDGGYQSNGGQAGAGTGGDAQINLAGGPTSLLAVGINAGAEVDRSTTLDSSGYGGSAGGVANGIGGAGTGGWSRIYGTGGSADFRGDVRIAAEGEGGNGENGAGGAGIGGRARLNADGAAYHVAGSATIVTDALGGFGRDGGAASLRAVVDDSNNSGMFANNGGSIVVDGFASLSANATGGAGTNGGNGGAATAGRSSVVASGSALGNGSITLASVSVTAAATGGSGAAGINLAGGNGGNATGGLAELIANNSASGTNRLTVGAADLDAPGTGGSGGVGGDGTTGSNGGSGGNGNGGTALALTSAGNGAVAITDLSLFATGTGGAGGAGGSGSEGAGGNGGAGGIGDGGTVIAGLISGSPTPTTAGTFNAATLIGWADSYGGAGGDGGVGTAGLGNGGHGGNALHSFNQLIARGGTVTIGEAQLLVDTAGGDGGSGAIAGNGGTAYTPDILVTVTNRFEQPAAGATLSVGDLNFYSFARGGTGAVAGQAIALGGPQLLVQNSRASFGSYRATSTAGDAIEPTSLADPIRILNGSVTVERDFLVATDNRMSVLIDAGALTAGSVTLDAFTFERDTTVPVPATLGTIGGGAIAVVSGRDIVLDANLSSTGALTLQAPGSVAVGGLSAIGTTGDILVTGTNVTTGAINAGGSVLVNAGGAIATGTITARRADLAALGAIGVGDVTTSEGFDAEAGGALAVGNVVAGEHIALAAQGAVRAGNLSAGLANAAVREGADYHIGILSGAAVAVGNAAARDWIGIGARGSLSAGTIASGNDVLLAADGAIATGAITTGAQNRLLIAGADMVALGGPTETFDRDRVFAALGTPAEAATRGAVTIGGAVSAGRIDARVGGDLTTGALSAGVLGISLRTGGALATGPINARTDVDLNAIGAMTTGTMASLAGGIRAIGGSGITTGGLAAAGGTFVDAGGLLTLNGNVAGPATFASADIDIAEGVRVDEAQLIARNAQGTFVGDAIGGDGGYRLSSAEYGRFGGVEITADTAQGAGSTMTIGDLVVASAGASEYGFRVGSAADESASGVIRIVGDVRYDGAAAGTGVGFEAGRFELDSATGSLALINAAGGLAGSIDISARQVWVADTAVLSRLGTDPAYAGLAADLARPSATRSADGVIRADTINIALARPGGDGAAAGPAYSVYVQNTGTTAAPAGFAAREASVETDEATPPAIDLNVYGQLVTASGTLTGVAVRDALMADDNPARFTAGSLINGCALTGACGATTAPPLDPQPAISTEIALLATPPADDALFGNEEAIEDNEEEGGDDSASSPISPPAPLFNTKPLEPKSDTDEPVSGGGNPALIGSGRVEGEK